MSSTPDEATRIAELRAQIREADKKLRAMGIDPGQGMTPIREDKKAREEAPPAEEETTKDPGKLHARLETILSQGDKLLEGRHQRELDAVAGFRELSKKLEKALAKVDQKFDSSIRSTEKAIQNALKTIKKTVNKTPIYICGVSSKVEELSGVNAETAAATAMARGLRIFGGNSQGRRRAFPQARGRSTGYRSRLEKTVGEAAAARPSAASEAREKRERERLERGVRQVMEAFPYITKLQASAALKKHSLDPTRTMTWMVSMDEIALLSALASLEEREKQEIERKRLAEAQKENLQESLSVVDLPGYPEGIERFLGDADLAGSVRGSRVFIYKVESISDDSVKLRGAFDRNGVTLHPGYAANHQLPLKEFLLAEGEYFRFFSPEENQRVMNDLRKRTLNITYQSFSEKDFSPIDVSPKGIDLFADYKVVYDERLKKLAKVFHRTDGPVLFSGEKDRGEFGLWDGEPIEIFTARHSDTTHRIVHLHLNDIREDIAIDAVNITGTDKTTADFKQLKKDTTGRLLSYRIVVKDSKVKAVYHHSGKSKPAKFVETLLPPLGSLVSLRDGALATLLWVPAGMVVSTEADPGVDPRQKAEHVPYANEACKCRRKHPVELPGMVDVRLEMTADALVFPKEPTTSEGEAKAAQKSAASSSSTTTAWGSAVEAKGAALEEKENKEGHQRMVSVCLCSLRAASEEERKRLEAAREAKKNRMKEELLSSLSTLESLIKTAEASLKKPVGGDAAGADSMSEMEALRKRVESLSLDKDMANVVEPRRMKAASRALRYIAFQRRANKKAQK